MPSAAIETCSDRKGMPARPPGGYRVTGTDPDSTTYCGTVTLQLEPPRSCRVVRETGCDQFGGTGTSIRKTLTVHWGTDAPAIHEIGSEVVGAWPPGDGTQGLAPTEGCSCQPVAVAVCLVMGVKDPAYEPPAWRPSVNTAACSRSESAGHQGASVRATRKPKSKIAASGKNPKRLAERAAVGS